MQIPFNSMKRQLEPEAEALRQAYERVFASGWFILGPEVQAFEAEFAAFHGANHGVALANGTDALVLALRAMDCRPGDEVVVPALTATPCYHAILTAGGVPVFAEMDEATLTLSPAAVEAVIGPRTRFVLAVHLYGRMADLDALGEICRRRGLTLIEDCAQAHGASRHGRMAGSVAGVGCFSFYPTKNLGALGDAGMVVCRSPAVADRLRLLRQYGEDPRYVCQHAGVNSRMDELQAAILRQRLPHLAETTVRRRQLAARYTAGLVGTPVVPPLDEPGHCYHLYVIRSPRRDELAAFLKARGIATAIHYPVPGHRQPMFANCLPHRAGHLALTERVCGEILSLPLYPGLEDAEVDAVCAAIREFHAGAKA